MKICVSDQCLFLCLLVRVIWKTKGGVKPLTETIYSAELRTKPVLRGAPVTQTEEVLQEVDDDEIAGSLPTAGDKAAQVILPACRLQITHPTLNAVHQ